MVNTTNEGLTGGLVFIRHGESENNVQKIYNSDPKNPAYQPVGLTATGREQVLGTSRRLLSQGIDGHTIGQVLISPLPRTIATAAIVMDVLSIRSDKSKVELRATEQRMGEREGQSFDDHTPWFVEHPERFGGESRSALQSRMASLLHDISAHWDLSRQFVLIISHGSPLLVAQEYLGLGNQRLQTGGCRVIPFAQIKTLKPRLYPQAKKY